MTDLSKRVETAFSFAQEAVKQMITLSTAIFALTLTFLKDVEPEGTPRTLLEVAWGCYLVSVLFGLCTLLNLAGHAQTRDSPSIYGGGIVIFGLLQVGFFFLALGLTLGYGLGAT